MSVIVTDQHTAALNNPIFDALRESTGISYSDIFDATKGANLRSVLELGPENYILGNLFKKLEDDLGLDPSSVTTNKAIEHVKKTKDATKHFYAILDAKPAVLMSILEKARSILCDILKGFSPFDIFPRYTLGATQTLPRGTDILTRIKTGCGYRTIMDSFDSATAGWLLANLPHVESSGKNNVTVFMTVPKTAQEARPIGLHEVYILAVQAGVHDYLAKVLKKQCNIDLANAQEKHRAYAEYYSVESDFCTMDQSNASQNILRAHCQYLLPEEFFSFVDKICPRVIVIDGIEYHHEMMMAQGNGITSALQTLIFYALIQACAWKKGISTEVLAFGDDTIFRSELFSTVDQVFTAIGFEVNKEKSFFSDSIRESCGADFWSGVNVRPFYVKQLPKTTDEWYRVCNGIYRVGRTNNNNCWRNRAFKHFWVRCIANIPRSERLFGPQGYGDTVLHHWDESKYTIKSTNAGLKIRGRVAVACQGGGNFGSLSKGIPARVLFKAVSNSPHLTGAGLVYKRLKSATQTDKAIYGVAYPNILGKRDVRISTQWINYPLSCLSDQSNIDRIFNDLSLDSDAMLKRYNQKLDYYRQHLIALMLKHMRSMKLSRSSIQDIILD